MNFLLNINATEYLYTESTVIHFGRKSHQNALTPKCFTHPSLSLIETELSSLFSVNVYYKWREPGE